MTGCASSVLTDDLVHAFCGLLSSIYPILQSKCLHSTIDTDSLSWRPFLAQFSLGCSSCQLPPYLTLSYIINTGQSMCCFCLSHIVNTSHQCAASIYHILLIPANQCAAFIYHILSIPANQCAASIILWEWRSGHIMSITPPFPLHPEYRHRQAFAIP